MSKPNGEKSKGESRGSGSNQIDPGIARELERMRNNDIAFVNSLPQEMREIMMHSVMDRSHRWNAVMENHYAGNGSEEDKGDTTEGLPSTSGQTPSKSIPAMSKVPDAVNPQRAMLPGNLKVNLKNIEKLLMEKPMVVLKYLEECITEKKNKGSGKLKDAFLRPLSLLHSKFVKDVNGMDPRWSSYRQNLFHLTPAVYLALKTAIDLPFGTPFDDNEDFGDEYCIECIGLANILDLKRFVGFVAKCSVFDVVYKMKDLMREELADSVLKEYLTREECVVYQGGLKNALKCFEEDALKYLYPQNALVELHGFNMIAGVYHTFGTALTLAKSKYLRTDKSKGSFKIKELPDTLQIKWLIEENPMEIFKTFEKWVTEKLVKHDYSSEDESYKQDVKRCQDYRTECLKFPDQENWEAFSSEQQEKVRRFVRFVHRFLRREEAILEAKNAARNEKKEGTKSSKSGILNENAVNHRRAMLPGNLAFNLSNVETLMVEKPMEVLKYLEERITEKKNKGSCKVKDAFLRTISVFHAEYVDIVNRLGSEFSTDQYRHLSRYVYFSLKTAIDMPFETPFGDNEDIFAEDCLDWFELDDILDLERFVFDVAKCPLYMLRKMIDRMKEEQKDSPLKGYLTIEDYEEYQKNLGKLSSCRVQIDFPQEVVKMQAFHISSEAYHMFGVALTQAKAQYLRTNKSKGPFKIKDLPDTQQINWLIEENPMDIFKTFEKWVTQKLVNRDYSNEDELCKKDAKKCKDFLTDCLKFPDQENWDEFSNEQQEKVRTFVRFVHGFLTRNEAILKVKNTAGNEKKEENKESSKSEIPNKNAVNLQRAVLPGNLEVNLRNVEALMLEKPMEVLKYIEELIMEKKNKGSCKAKDAFLRTLSRLCLQYADVVNLLDPKNLSTSICRQYLLTLSRAAYCSLKTAIDLPIATPFDDNEDFDEDECIDFFGLDELPDLKSYVFDAAKRPICAFKKMIHLMQEEQKNSALKKYLTIDDYEEYQEVLKDHLSCSLQIDPSKYFGPQKANVEMQIWDVISGVYHTFEVGLIRVKAGYLKTNKSKGPFKIKDLPDSFQIKWLIEENPMDIFKTFEKWVNQKLVNHDYSNEDESYKQDAKKCKDYRMECLKFPDQENWDEIGNEQQEKVRTFVQSVHGFLKRYHSEIFNFPPDTYSNANKSSKSKLRVQLNEIELDEYMESTSIDETPKKTEKTFSTRVPDKSNPTDSESAEKMEESKKLEVTRDTTEGSSSTSEETPAKSISAKKREQKKRREERKRNEASLEAKSIAGNEKEEDTKSSKSGISNENGVNPQRAMLPGNLKLNMRNVETLMVEKPMEVLEYLEERINEKKNKGSCKVKDAFLTTLSKFHSGYMHVIIGSDPKSARDQEPLRRLSRYVYFSLKTAIDLPFETPFDDNPYFDEDDCTDWFGLEEIPDLESLIFDCAKCPMYVFEKMVNLMRDEQKNSPLKEYLNEDYEDYQEELKEHLEDSLQVDPKKYLGPQKAIVEWKALEVISEAYHMFGVMLTRAKSQYLQTEKSKGPFRIRDLPDSLQIKWLIEENPMSIYKTFEKWVNQKLVNHDYSNEDKWYKQDAKRCLDYGLECLEYPNQENWDEFSSEQQEKVGTFVEFVHDFLESYHFDMLNCSPDTYSNANKSTTSKLRVQPHEIELDEYIESTSRDKKTTSMIFPKKAIAGGNLKKSDSNLKSGLKTPEDHQNSNVADKPRSQERTSQKTEQSISTRVPEELAKIVNENLRRMGSSNKKDKGKTKTENGCQNENCMDFKKLYRQEQNNRTIAEGELKRAAYKIKGYDILKKEEENWKVEKKRMEKEMRRLRENKDNEIKELREEIEKLKESNREMEEHRKNTFELYLETKKSLQETTRSFESLRDSTIIINMETKRVLEENRQLNGPYTLKYSSPEQKLKVFKELKEKFNPTEIIEKVNTMAEIFPEKSPEFEIALETEQKRVETSSDIYSRILEYNLKLIEDTNSTSGLLPVPFPPTVSEQFEKVFKRGLEKLEGKECYVCFKRLEIGEKIYVCAEFHKHIVCFECGNNMIVQWKGKCGFCPGDLNESTYDVSMDE